jgi:uncharacterized Zn-binding protein involved in type VI secretion
VSVNIDSTIKTVHYNGDDITIEGFLATCGASVLEYALCIGQPSWRAGIVSASSST